MISEKQIEELAKEFHIDGFTVIREYLQLVFLSYLYQTPQANKIFFKGGTAIRLIFGSLRFSEDLDFSTIYNKKQITFLVSKLEKQISNELPGLQIPLLYSGKNGIRFRIKYKPINFKYPLNIRLDFNIVQNVGRTNTTALITKFPIIIFPLVIHLSGEEILKEKIEALLSREKGRDLFDLWFLLEKGIPLRKKILKKSLLRKIKAFTQKQLNLDLSKFLPQSHRSLTKIIKEKLIQRINQV